MLLRKKHTKAKRWMTEEMSAREMAEVLGITLRGCERILASLKQRGLIVRVGANKGGHWKIVLD